MSPYHSILCPHDLRGTDSSLALWMSMWLRNDLDNYKKFNLRSGSQYGIILLPMGPTFGNVLQHFWSSRLGRSVGEYSCISWHQRMLLNALQCTGKPPQQRLIQTSQTSLVLRLPPFALCEDPNLHKAFFPQGYWLYWIKGPPCSSMILF